MDDLKTYWTKEEILDLIAEAELLGKKDFAGRCRICSEQNPVIIRCIINGLTTCCPQCFLDHLEVKEYEEEQTRLEAERAQRAFRAGYPNGAWAFPMRKK
jgi:hypothetical protein